MYDHEIDPIQANPENSGVDLAIQLARTVADTVVASSIAHGYHWNIIGPDFNEYHAFFGAIYEDYNDSIDTTAENILKLGHEAPYLLSDFVELTCIDEERVDGSDTRAMLESLHRVNGTLIGQFDKVFYIANEIGRQDIADYAAGRLDAHHRWAWQIKATLGIR